MKNIVLLGFMGTGKSAVGRRLAAELKYQFIDTDKIIEERTRKRISEIFAEQGEAPFRELESQVVLEVAQRNRYVISTGGGIVLNPDNLNALRQNGILVALQARPEVILRRVQRRVGQRPLLKGPDPLSNVKRLLMEREPYYYRSAAFTLDTSDMSVNEVVHQIKKRVLEIEGRTNSS